MKRKIILIIIIVFFIIIIIPATVLFIFDLKTKVRIGPIKQPIIVFNHNTGKLMEMDLEEYLIGVVAQEMPASFEEEALKAQAMAARTYAYKRILEADPRVKELHSKADISTNPNISQAWVSNDEMREKWGIWDYLSYRKKIADAVKGTEGQLLAFNGNLIDPVYHSSCGGGRTENSEEVWKYSFPYLVSVKCAEHKEGHNQDVKAISLENIDVSLGTNLAKLTLSELKADKCIKVQEKSKGGRIKTISIGGKVFRGTELRTKLGLKSTWFTWEVKEKDIVFTTKGYGHAVGMCQYGANHLAKEGKNYIEILEHYYKGVEIIHI